MPVDVLDYKKTRADRLERSGLPDTKTERWRKFDISAITEADFAEAPLKTGEPSPRTVSQWENLTDKIEILNGSLNLPEKEKQALASRFSFVENRDQIGKAGDERGAFFYDLNSSLISDYSVITVKKGISGKPLYLPQHIEGDKNQIRTNPRLVIILEEGAELELIQSFSSSGKPAVFHNSVTEIIMNKNSRLDHLVLQEERDEAHVFNHLFIRQMTGSRYHGRNLINGGKLSRNEYHIALKEENCETQVDSLYLGKGERNHNSDVTVYHDAPLCTSRTESRAIALDKGMGTFRGYALIARDAQKSDAVQQFKTILLDDTAEINMEPQLEIWADDVKCSHGATVGSLDKKQLFYLQTRGFTEDQARRILLEAFASRLADGLDMGGIGPHIKEKISGLMEGLYE
ncbi:Fe-S cluster assembly protein SufD [Spirochaeta isovalerica]|uniref:Fe-S cluster assembly protein SufD n=1 Tax=Spirochaeta isovalerica TaxID=150 RepID=A0A841RCE5_9SPIO|nr:Fe-S cluster assembly protein SufD [Spirochaeta isovalerica]MBB6480072.1 Fe-S cluster assembly protein SufD [Spirochaeta isovalerica]